MNLNQLGQARKAIIDKINLQGPVRERLHSLGLIENTEISFIKNAPLGCPKIYQVMNTLVAIRNKIAKKIEIQTSNEQ